MLAVDLGALGLAVGAVGASDVGAFVPGEADPLEGVEDHLLGGGDEAGAVGVFDAEDELAAALAGEEVVEEADVGGADVGVAGGRGGDADADGAGSGAAVVLGCHKASRLMLTARVRPLCDRTRWRGGCRPRLGWRWVVVGGWWRVDSWWAGVGRVAGRRRGWGRG